MFSALPWLNDTNVTTLQVFTYLYAEYSKHMEASQNKALDDLGEEVDITRPSIKPFQIKQEKLKLFLQDTE